VLNGLATIPQEATNELMNQTVRVVLAAGIVKRQPDRDSMLQNAFLLRQQEANSFRESVPHVLVGKSHGLFVDQ
jgi:hypothetical protein